MLTVLATFLIASPAYAYTVEKGDTMTQIAKQHKTSLKALAKVNPEIQNLDLIYIGQTIHIPDNETKIDPQVHQASASIKVEAPAASTSEQVQLSENEIDLLARIVRAEAQTEPFEGKVAVADVVLNRVESPQFPDTVKDVIYAPGQFQPVSNGEINKPADEESVEAVYTALADQNDAVEDSLFFYNPHIATNRWLDSRETTVVIGQHVFKK